MHDALYASAPRLDEEHLVAAARRAGIADLDRWNRDRNDEALRPWSRPTSSRAPPRGQRHARDLRQRQGVLGQKNERELRDRLEEELDLIGGHP